MSKKIVITGVAGFAGSHFLEHVLVNTDWEIVALLSFRHRGVPERVLDSDHYQKHKARVSMITADLSQPMSAIARRKIGSFDYLVNYASDSHVDRSIADPVTFVRNNVDLMLTVLELCRRTSPEKIVHIGTDEEFGPAAAGYRRHEWEPAIPSNPYAASKSAQSSLAISYWRTYGLPVMLTQTMNLIGERQDPEKFVPMCIGRILRGEAIGIHGRKITDAFGTRTETGSRHYLHARNQADAVLFLLNNVSPQMYPSADRPSRFNIVGDKEVSNLRMVQHIEEIVGKEARYEIVDFHSARPGHDLRYALDGWKLATLGWKAPFTFESSLAKTVRWSLEHPEWLSLAEGRS